MAEAHALLDELMDLLQPLAGPATHHGAREVAEVAGALRARKDVHHHRLVGPDRAVALFVRIHGLVAGGADRVGGHAPTRHDGVVDHGAEVFGVEATTVAAQEAVAADPARAQRAEPGLEARLRGAQRLDDRAHLVRPLPLALGPERIRRRAHANAEAFQVASEADREAARHLDAA